MNESISYSELSKLVGADVTAVGRCYLQTARRRLLADDQIHIATIWGVGVKRVDDSVIVQSDRALKHIVKTARRRRAELHAVNYDKLDRELQRKHNVELTQTGAIIYFAKDNTAKRIEGIVAKENSELPIGKTLEFFSSKKGLA